MTVCILWVIRRVLRYCYSVTLAVTVQPQLVLVYSGVNMNKTNTSILVMRIMSNK